MTLLIIDKLRRTQQATNGKSVLKYSQEYNRKHVNIQWDACSTKKQIKTNWLWSLIPALEIKPCRNKTFS